MRYKEFLPFLFLLTFIYTSSVFAQTQVSKQNQEPTIILFRHAEKMNTSRDPDLSPVGIERSNTLFHMLKDLEITAIYSTSYKRTMQTIQPLADSLELPVNPYDPRDLTGFAEMLKKTTGVILISGHSNTTPTLSSLILGYEVAKINEDEYDNLYIITSASTNPVLTKLRYPTFY
jgi:phosphohistidine phosphatase SixA